MTTAQAVQREIETHHTGKGRFVERISEKRESGELTEIRLRCKERYASFSRSLGADFLGRALKWLEAGREK